MMGKTKDIYCSVPDCTSKGSKGFHHYPSNENIRSQWLKRTKTMHLRTCKELKNSRICYKHFEETDFEPSYEHREDTRIRLRKTAVPSQSLPGPLKLKFEHNYANNSKVQEHSLVSILSPQLHETLELSLPVNRLNKNSINQSQTESLMEIDDSNGSFNSKSPEIESTRGAYRHIEKILSPHTCDGICELEQKLKDCMAEKAVIAKKLGISLKKIILLKQKQRENKLNSKTAPQQYLKKTFNREQNLFFQMQLRNNGRKPNGRRYTLEEKSFCLASYKQGPKHYRFMERSFKLPVKRTLGRHSASLHFKTGIDPKLFEFIEAKVKSMPVIDRYCILSWDEVALTAHLDYDHSNDLIDGFVDLATERRPSFATHSLTFMIRGMNSPYKQTVGFFYTDSLMAFELAALIRLMIKAVLKTGLIVIMSTCDQINSNGAAVNELINLNCPRKNYLGELLEYIIDGKTIIHCYDAPHLIKVVRNNLHTKNLRHCISIRWNICNSENGSTANSYIASWDDIEDIYLFDLEGTERLLNNITDEHINPNRLKMKVHVATQIFSETYGRAMLNYSKKKEFSRDCSATAEVLFFFNDLFDSFNGAGPPQDGTLKGSISENSIHFAYWNYALSMLSKMAFVDKGTEKVNNGSSVIFRLMSTIRGFIEITKTCMNLNMKQVSLRNANQDGLENLFGCVKSCNNVARKSIIPQYKTGYTTMIINNLSSANTLSTNCEKDISIPLVNDLHDFLQQCREKTPENNNYLISKDENQTLDIIEFEPEFSEVELNVVEDEALSYVSSIVCRKILQKTDCENCISEIQTNPHWAYKN